jgi:succinyl-CoA synthetase alpha subunit
MSILVGEHTRLCVAGITGREGSFHTLNNRSYGTNVVAGVTPGKGGQDVEGIPVFDSWSDAVAAASPNTAMIFVPPRFAADAILEAAAAGVELVVAITEGIPAHDELRVYNTLKRDHPGTRLVGPNCPGILSPGKANVGIIPASFFKAGNVGVVSRSGTLTYQIGSEIAQAGLGNSSIVGIGGDPVPGSSFVDILELFQADDQTELIVLSGEIGGSAEEEAAAYIAQSVTKPVIAYIAGFTAPEGKTMGHAGAIVSGSAGTAKAKAAALEDSGVRVARTPTEVADLAPQLLGNAVSASSH